MYVSEAGRWVQSSVDEEKWPRPGWLGEPREWSRPLGLLVLGALWNHGATYVLSTLSPDNSRERRH